MKAAITLAMESAYWQGALLLSLHATDPMGCRIETGRGPLARVFQEVVLRQLLRFVTYASGRRSQVSVGPALDDDSCVPVVPRSRALARWLGRWRDFLAYHSQKGLLLHGLDRAALEQLNYEVANDLRLDFLHAGKQRRAAWQVARLEAARCLHIKTLDELVDRVVGLNVAHVPGGGRAATSSR